MSSDALFVTALAVLSPMLTILRSIPQALRVKRCGAEGVSSTTWILLLAISELWTIYGVLARVPAEVVTNIPNGLLCLVVVVLVARHRRRVSRTLVAAAAISFAIAAFTAGCVLGHATSIESTVAVAGSLALYVPQLVTTLRRSDLGGISASSWSLACLSAISWGLYGLAIHKLPVYLPAVVMVPSAFVIVLRVLAAKAAGTAATDGGTLG